MKKTRAASLTAQPDPLIPRRNLSQQAEPPLSIADGNTTGSVTWCLLVVPEACYSLGRREREDCSRTTSRSPIRRLARRAVPPCSDALDRRISVLPQFSTILPTGALHAAPYVRLRCDVRFWRTAGTCQRRLFHNQVLAGAVILAKTLRARPIHCLKHRRLSAHCRTGTRVARGTLTLSVAPPSAPGSSANVPPSRRAR